MTMTAIDTRLRPEAHMASSIQENLRQIMERQTISARELARRAAVKASFIYDILNGKSTNPSTIKLARVAECLGVSLAALLDNGRETKHTLSLIAPGVVDAFPVGWLRLDPATRQLIEDGEAASVPPLFFSRLWLARHTTQQEGLALYSIEDDAMEPTLKSGDTILLDQLQTLPAPPGLFVLYDGLNLLVRRLEHFRRGHAPYIRVGADNPRYRSDELPLDDITIIGRVLWVSRTL